MTTSLSANPSGLLFPSIWKLLRLRLLLAWNAFKHAKIGRKIGTIAIAVLVVGLAGIPPVPELATAGLFTFPFTDPIRWF